MKHTTPAQLSIADRLAVLAEPIRLRMCRLIEGEELSVGEVAKVFKIAQSSASRHLRVLREAGWIRGRAAGTATFYTMIPDDLEPASRRTWATVRDELNKDAGVRFLLDEDDRRVQMVVAERRNDSMAYFGRVAGEWDEIRAQLFGSDFTASALVSLLPSDWVVADIGCGTGNAAELLAPRVEKVLAVDASDVMLDAARDRLSRFDNVEFVRADATGLPFDDDTVDAVMCLLVLHHLADPGAAMREFARVVKPGGRVAVVDMYRHDREEFVEQMGHAHLGFRDADVSSMFIDAGLADPKIGPIATDSSARAPGLFVAAGDRPG